LDKTDVIVMFSRID